MGECKGAGMCGCSSNLNYVRNGQDDMNKCGPYKKFYPEVLKVSKGRFHVDYGFHHAPMDSVHNGEIEMLIEKFGVASFKIFMLYGPPGLPGPSDSHRDLPVIGKAERSQYAALESGLPPSRAAREKPPEPAPHDQPSLA